MKKIKLILTLLSSTMLVGALASCGDDIRGEEVSIGGMDIEITEPVDSQYLQPQYLNFSYYKTQGEEYLRIYLALPKINQEVINIAPQYGGYDVRYLTTYIFDQENTSTKKIILPDTMKGIDGYTFSNFQALEEVVISKSVSYISPLVFYHSNVKKVTIDKENEYYEVKNDALYQKKDNLFVHYSNNDDLKQYSVYQATDVLDYAFSYTNLESIVFSEGVEKIAYNALYNNEYLESITLPSTFKSISHSSAYSEAINTKSMFSAIKEQNPKLKTIYTHVDLNWDLSELNIEVIKI